MKRVIILVTAVCLFGCQQKAAQAPKIHRTYNPAAVKLNDSAIKVAKALSIIPRPQVLATVIGLLNQATAIDSSYYTAYWNKRNYQVEALKYADALATGKQMIKLSPNNPDDYTCLGMLSERLLDTASAYKYFKLALPLYANVLDTLADTSKNHNPLLVGKALDLIMLNRRADGVEILNKLRSGATDVFDRDMYHQLTTIGKNGIVNVYVPGKYDE